MSSELLCVISFEAESDVDVVVSRGLEGVSVVDAPTVFNGVSELDPAASLEGVSELMFKPGVLFNLAKALFLKIKT